MSGRAPGDVVGETVKALREGKGWSQETAAQRLQERGLPWTRSRLADLEIPSRRRPDLTLTELVLLAETFSVRLEDLLAGSGQVQLGKTERPLEVVRARVSGAQPRDENLSEPQRMAFPDPFASESEPESDTTYWIRLTDRGGIFYNATEVEAARRLDIDVERVNELARELWEGRSIHAERQRLLAARGGRDAAEITTRLIDDLRKRVEVERLKQGNHAP